MFQVGDKVVRKVGSQNTTPWMEFCRHYNVPYDYEFEVKEANDNTLQVINPDGKVSGITWNTIRFELAELIKIEDLF